MDETEGMPFVPSGDEHALMHSVAETVGTGLKVDDVGNGRDSVIETDQTRGDHIGSGRI
jgi:hypothetical protein